VPLMDSLLSQKLFEPIAKEESLKLLALREGFLKKPRENRTLVVGIDIRCVSLQIAKVLALMHL
jgi:hypothetical protein